MFNDSLIEEVKKKIFKINKELVEDSIKRTQWFFSEKIHGLQEKIYKVWGVDEEKNKLKAEFHQIIMEEDLPYEREIKKINEERTNESKKKYQKKMNKFKKKVKEKIVKKENLFPDDKEPRRRKNDKLDKSSIVTEINYEQFLQNKKDFEDIIFDNLDNDNISNHIEEKMLRRPSITKSNLNINKINSSQINSIESKKFTNKFMKNNLNNINKFDSRQISKQINFNNFQKKTIKISDSFLENDESNFYFNFKNSKLKGLDKPTFIGSSSSQIKNLNVNNLLDDKIKSNKNMSVFYVFKAKSVEKNIDKYPKENSKEFLVKEENKPYKDPLTVKQEGIPDNLRGKKY